MNRYSSWKYIVIIFLIGLGLLFALPNIYGKDPSLQISAARSAEISENHLNVLESNFKLVQL